MKKIYVETKDKMLLTLDEAVALSGIGKNTLKRLIKEECPELGVKIGTTQKVKREALEQFVRESTQIDSFRQKK